MPAAAEEKPKEPWSGMKYRMIGPWRGGRSVAAVGLRSDPNTYYTGTTGGGVWKTTNAGVTWDPIFDDQGTSSIGAIAVADSDPNVVYVGTGEACIRGNLSHGDGVYKSTDAGKTWTHVGLKETRQIGDLLVHPKDADLVYVAALGHAYGNNSERGVFRSRDGGKSWEKVLYKDDKTGAIDLSMDPSNPNILFAALWEAGRTPWSLTSGGPGSSLHKSTDGGTTWKKVEGNGWPDTTLGRIGVAISPADPSRVYVILEALEEKGGVYRSDDGGEHWKQLTDDHRLRQRPWYYTHVTADPKNAEAVYVLNTSLYRSSNGGKDFEPIGPPPHGDHHMLWIAPDDPKRMINADDGGGTISVDGGKTWSRQDNQPTAQFYHVIADNQFPYYVYGSQQDNSSVGIRSRGDSGAITRADWNAVGGGEAGYIAPHPTNPDIVYAGEYIGILTRFDRKTGQAHNISVWPDDTDGHHAADMKYRFNWTQPIVASRHDPRVLYYTGNIVFRSSDEGMSWEAISPDLTRNDKSKQQRSGGPITGENISIETYDVVFSLAESPLQKDVLWAGTDDGLVHVTRDGGKTWQNVTPKDLPEWSMVSQVDASAHDAGTAYIAVDRHKLDDLKPHVWKTSDYGKSWTKIVNGIGAEAFVRVVREDPKKKGLLYAGTETGLWVSRDDGARWQTLQLNLPRTPIHDLVVKDDDLVVATHGRAFWILDDLAPLRQWSDAVTSAAFHLFKPSSAWRVRSDGGRGSFLGENPPSGAILYYHLKEKPKEDITLEVLDGSGQVIRKLTSKKKEVKDKPLPERVRRSDEDPKQLPTSAGLNRFVWDLRHELPELIGSAIFDLGDPVGPLALPGSYQVRLNVAGKSETAPLEVRLDPRVATPHADLVKQLEASLQVRQLIGEIHEAVGQMRDLRGQLTALKVRAGDKKPVASAAEAIEAKLSPLEAALIEVKARSSQDMCNYPTMLNGKVAYLDNVIDSADRAPTRQALELFEVHKAAAQAQLGPWRELLAKEVPALNELIQKEGVLQVSVSGTP